MYRVSFHVVGDAPTAKPRRYVGVTDNMTKRKRDHQETPPAWMKICDWGRPVKYEEDAGPSGSAAPWEELRLFCDTACAVEPQGHTAGPGLVRGACWCVPSLAKWTKESESLEAYRFVVNDWPESRDMQDEWVECAAARFTLVARQVGGACFLCGGFGHYAETCRRGWQPRTAEEAARHEQAAQQRQRARLERQEAEAAAQQTRKKHQKQQKQAAAAAAAAVAAARAREKKATKAKAQAVKEAQAARVKYEADEAKRKEAETKRRAEARKVAERVRKQKFDKDRKPRGQRDRNRTQRDWTGEWQKKSQTRKARQVAARKTKRKILKK